MSQYGAHRLESSSAEACTSSLTSLCQSLFMLSLNSSRNVQFAIVFREHMIGAFDLVTRSSLTTEAGRSWHFPLSAIARFRGRTSESGGHRWGAFGLGAVRSSSVCLNILNAATRVRVMINANFSTNDQKPRILSIDLPISLSVYVSNYLPAHAPLWIRHCQPPCPSIYPIQFLSIYRPIYAYFYPSTVPCALLRMLD